MIKSNSDTFLNLSDCNLSQDEKHFLNLGLKFHIAPKYSKFDKQVELEKLYYSLLNLHSKGEITINQTLTERLRAEGTKHRNLPNKEYIPPRLLEAAKSLRSNPNIVIRKADKSSNYVILNKTDYINKIETMLADQTKFEPIPKDPTNRLKKDINKIITAINATHNTLNFNKIIGDYQPGYIYGNVKTHKQNNPLRPIISQIPTPTYEIANIIWTR